MGRINLKSLKVSFSKDSIVSFKPFYFSYIGLDSLKHFVTFKCPICGSKSCEKIDSIEPFNFWSGHFRCTVCGAVHDKNLHEFNYYNDCFIDKSEPFQLELF